MPNTTRQVRDLLLVLKPCVTSAQVFIVLVTIACGFVVVYAVVISLYFNAIVAVVICRVVVHFIGIGTSPKVYAVDPVIVGAVP